jgi:hypothetical protein
MSTYKVIPSSGDLGEPLLEQSPDVRTTRLMARFKAGLPLGIQQFTMEQKLGYPDRLMCSCGQSLELPDETQDYDAATSKLSSWLSEHSDCEAKE